MRFFKVLAGFFISPAFLFVISSSAVYFFTAEKGEAEVGRGNFLALQFYLFKSYHIFINLLCANSAPFFSAVKKIMLNPIPILKMQEKPSPMSQYHAARLPAQDKISGHRYNPAFLIQQ